MANLYDKFRGSWLGKKMVDYWGKVARWETGLQQMAAGNSDAVVSDLQSVMKLSNKINPAYQIPNQLSKLVTGDKKWIFDKGMGKVNSYVDKIKDAGYWTNNKNSIASNIGGAWGHVATAIVWDALLPSGGATTTVANGVRKTSVGNRLLNRLNNVKTLGPSSSKVTWLAVPTTLDKAKRVVSAAKNSTPWQILRTAAKYTIKLPDTISKFVSSGIKNPILKWAVRWTTRWATSAASTLGFWNAANKIIPGSASDKEKRDEMLWSSGEPTGMTTNPTAPPTATDRVEWQNNKNMWGNSINPTVQQNQDVQQSWWVSNNNVSGTAYNQNTWGTPTPASTTAPTQWEDSGTTIANNIMQWYRQMVYGWATMEASDKYYYDSYKKVNDQLTSQGLAPLAVPTPTVGDPETYAPPSEAKDVPVIPESVRDYSISNAKINAEALSTENSNGYRYNSTTGAYEIKWTIPLVKWDMKAANELYNSFTSNKRPGSWVWMASDFGISQDVMNSFLKEVIWWSASRFVPTGWWTLSWLVELLKQQQWDGDNVSAQDTWAKLKMEAGAVADQLKSKMYWLYKTADWQTDFDAVKRDPIFQLADQVYNWAVRVTAYYDKWYSDIRQEVDNVGTTKYTTWYKSLDGVSEQRKQLMVQSPLYQKYLWLLADQDEVLYKQLQADAYSSEITRHEQKFLAKLKSEVYQGMKDWFQEVMNNQWYDAAKAAYPMNAQMKELVNISYRTSFDDLLSGINLSSRPDVSNVFEDTKPDLNRMYANNDTGYIQKIDSFQGIV